MSAARQTGTTAKRAGGDQDDIRSGLAALQAQMESMEVRMDERFESLAELIDAKLSPIRDMATEQRAVVHDHGRRLTQIETVIDKEVAPAVKQTWRTRDEVQALHEHAKRCDERNKTSGNRWWRVLELALSPAIAAAVGWLLGRKGG